VIGHFLGYYPIATASTTPLGLEVTDNSVRGLIHLIALSPTFWFMAGNPLRGENDNT